MPPPRSHRGGPAMVSRRNAASAMYITARRLAGLEKGNHQNVQPDIRASIRMFQRCIDKYKHRGAMYDLAQILVDTNVPACVDVPRAVWLLEKCIVDGNTDAMCKLADVFVEEMESTDSEGLNLRVIDLYQRSIEQGNNVPALFSLANVLISGRYKGVERDVARAMNLLQTYVKRSTRCDRVVQLASVYAPVGGADKRDASTFDIPLAINLCQICISTRNDPKAILALAEILVVFPSDTSDVADCVVELCNKYLGLQSDCRQVITLAKSTASSAVPHVENGTKLAVSILEACVVKRSDLKALFHLAEMLKSRQVHVDRFVNLCNQYIDAGNSCTAIINLASNIAWGTPDSDAVREESITVRLLTICIDKRNDSCAMLVLAELLVSGARGCPRDVERAVTLCERIIEKSKDCGRVIEFAKDVATGSERIKVQDGTLTKRLLQLCIDKKHDFDAMLLLPIVLATEESVGCEIDAAIQLCHTHLVSCLGHGTHCENVIKLAGAIAVGALDGKMNVQLAMQLCKICVKRRNNANARIAQAEFILCNTSNVQKRRGQVLKLIETALDGKGDHCRVAELASELLNGDADVPQNLPLAARICELCIEKREHYAEPMVILAEILVTNDAGVANDMAAAVKLCARAVKNSGATDRIVQLARKMAHGKMGVIHDAYHAVQLCEMCITNGTCTDGMIALAELLFSGADDVPSDVERAMELCLKSVDMHVRNDTFCFHAVNVAKKIARGTSELDGHGAFAARLYETCVRKWRDCRAMYYLAEMLLSGCDGVVKDEQRAEALFKAAAEAGFGGGYENEVDEIVDYLAARQMNRGRGSAETALPE